MAKPVFRCNYCSLAYDKHQALVEHTVAVHTQPSVTMQPHVVLTALDGTAHLVPGGSSQMEGVPMQQQQQHELVEMKPNVTSATIIVPDPTADPVPLSGTGDSLFCPDCKNSFANKYSLTKHLRTTKCRKESELAIVKIINDQLTCGKCLKQYGSMEMMKKHLTCEFPCQHL